MPLRIRVPRIAALSGTQTLTPALFTNSQTFYAATVGRGAVALIPSLFTNTQTFYAPTVGRAVWVLTPALFTNSQTFYGPTVSSQGGIFPPLLSNSQTFYAATVAAGSVTLLPALFSNAQTFYGPTISQGAGVVNLLPSLLTNTQAFYSAIIGGSFLVYADPSYAIQKALVARLRANVMADVYGNVPSRNPFPRITVGIGQTLGNFADCYEGSESFAQIDIWSRKPGFAQAKTIANQVRAALDDEILTLDGHTMEFMRFESSQWLRDPDGVTSHIAMTFRILSQPQDP